MPTFKTLVLTAAASCFLTGVTACKGDSDTDKNREHATEHGVAAEESHAVKPTGNKVTFKMITDSKGERYSPGELTAQRGDTVEFALESGVHNVHFLAEKNPPNVKLPPMGAYLQLPGQKDAFLIGFPEGRYYFQCDIHVMLGMKGYLTVTDED